MNPPTSPHLQRLRLIRQTFFRLALAFFSICIFILSLIVMKEGAKPLAPLIRGAFSVDSPASALGFGWLGASLALSGSPIAATALALLDARVLDPIESFSMIAGSRLGASFVVLLLGFIYMIRGKQRDVSLSVGLLALLVTQTAYPFVISIGYFLLDRGWLGSIQMNAANELDSPFEILLEPFVNLIKTYIPPELMFPSGVLLVLLALRLFDKAIPELNLSETNLGQVHHLLYRPIVTFILGVVVTSITMSVSVSLGLLVPLSVRGYIRRENVIPYILGANITTFIDTLVAAAMLGNSAAVTIVLVQMVSVLVVSLCILLLGFRNYERLIQRLVNFIGNSRLRLTSYIAVIFIIPFVLLWLG